MDSRLNPGTISSKGACRYSVMVAEFSAQLPVGLIGKVVLDEFSLAVCALIRPETFSSVFWDDESGKGLPTDLGTKTLRASGTDLKSSQGIGPRFSEDS